MIVKLPGYQKDGDVWVATTDPTFIATVAVNTVAGPMTPVPSPSTPIAAANIAAQLPPARVTVVNKYSGTPSGLATPLPSAIPAPNDGAALASTAAVNQGSAAAQTNALAGALSAVAAANTQASNGVVAAVNQTVAATDKVQAAIGALAANSHQATSTANANAAAVNSYLATLHDDITGGPTVTPGAAPVPGTTASAFAPDENTKAKVIGKLPVAPTLGALTPSSVLAFTIQVPKLDGSTLVSVTKTIDFAEPPFAAPVAIFRGICMVVLTLVYFLASFWAVRGAFAGK